MAIWFYLLNTLGMARFNQFKMTGRNDTIILIFLSFYDMIKELFLSKAYK
jgi:hypothetical protein